LVLHALPNANRSLGFMEKRRSADGEGARLPFRWPRRETGKTFAFSMPSRPANIRTAQLANAEQVLEFLYYEDIGVRIAQFVERVADDFSCKLPESLTM
jgi:hypothetical protein